MGISVGIFLSARFFWVRIEIMLQYCVVPEGSLGPLACFQAASSCLFWVVFGLLGIAAVVSLAAEILQVGVNFNFESLTLQSTRINPINGFKRIYSGIGELWQFVVRLLLTAGVFLFMLVGLIRSWSSLIGAPEMQVVEFIIDNIVRFWISGFLSLCVLAIIDYAVRHRKYYKELGMSYDEVRREQREEEGDPYIRMMRRSMHEMLVNENIVDRIRKAKVVIVEEQLDNFELK